MGGRARKRAAVLQGTRESPGWMREKFHTLGWVALCPVTWRSQCCPPGEPATRGDWDICRCMDLHVHTELMHVLASQEEQRCWVWLSTAVLAAAVHRGLWALPEAVKRCKCTIWVTLFWNFPFLGAEHSLLCGSKSPGSQIWPKGSISTGIWLTCWVCMF